jgi:CBS domain-containing protein
VLDGALLVGVFSERDLVAAVSELGAGALDLPVRAAMARDLTACRPESALQDVMAVMTKQRVRHLPVLDDGVLCGIVSIGDIVKHRLREVETEAGVLRDYITVTRTSARAH